MAGSQKAAAGPSTRGPHEISRPSRPGEGQFLDPERPELPRFKEILRRLPWRLPKEHSAGIRERSGGSHPAFGARPHLPVEMLFINPRGFRNRLRTPCGKRLGVLAVETALLARILKPRPGSGRPEKELHVVAN